MPNGTSESALPNDQAIDQPAAVRPGEMLDTERLYAFLRDHLPDARAPLHVEQFPSGFSNLTYLLRLGERELVLRRPPFGANIKSGHDMGREYRILSALSKTYPKVPRPLVYAEDPAIIGAPFYIMERVSGVILRARLPQGLKLEPELMRRICHSLIDTLVELHRLDYAAAGLADLGRPEGYVERQVGGWAARYANARTDDVPAMEHAAAWLQGHLPPTSGAALIHNDYKYDNVVLDPTDPTRIKAILDWEMATLGDPLTDVGTTLAYWAEPDDPLALRQFGLTTLPGNLDRQQWVERYAARSGRDVGNILFYYVYGLFKNGVIVQQIYYRYRQGHTHDERFARLIDLVRLHGDMAMRAIEQERIHHLFA
ncbi:MAG TPA: phosphotransferase family protein [Herpetosiphonaceae bacterium]